MSPFLSIILGLVCLAVGGEILVRGAAEIARRLGLSELVIGLTVVAFATSAPELAVSLNAAYHGHADVAFGNVVGSNIFNILFVLGLSALVAPLIVDRQLVRRDVPIMIGLSLLTYWFARNGRIEHYEAFILLALLVGYVALSLILARKGHRDGTSNAVELVQNGASSRSEQLGDTCKPRQDIVGLIWNVVIFVGLLIIVGIGVGVLMLGAKLFVDGAVMLARLWGVSELIIAVTLVAAGTSLPEAAASIVAGLRGRRDIAIGNVVGSNIFNILCVLGLGTLVTPDGMNVAEEALASDVPIMIGVAVACLPIFVTEEVVGRFEGFLLFAYYLAYTANLVLAVLHSPYTSAFRQIMIGGVIPLTAVFLIVSLLHHIVRRKRSRSSE